jgi:hypothetical protein
MATLIAMENQMNPMIKRATRMAAGLLIVSAVFTACGGAARTPSAAGAGESFAPIPSSASRQTTTPSAVAAAIDACALVTQPEAATLLGFDPGAGTSTGTDAAPACAYGASLTIGVALADGKSQFDSKTSGSIGSANDHVIDGVGDQANALVVANTVADFEILKGSVNVSVMVQGDPVSQYITVDALTALGKTIAGRL